MRWPSRPSKSDVHVVGVSSLAGGHRAHLPKLIDALRAEGRPDITVVAGGIIPEADHTFLKEAGVQQIFGPGTAVFDAALGLLTFLEQLLDA